MALFSPLRAPPLILSFRKYNFLLKFTKNAKLGCTKDSNMDELCNLEITEKSAKLKLNMERERERLPMLKHENKRLSLTMNLRKFDL